MLSEPILVVAKLVQVFDALGVPYIVGGSLASSVYGVPRATQDVDLVADLDVSHAEHLERLLTGDFYVDADMIRDAVVRRGSFNVIHLATMFKADVFVMKRDAWSREEMSRARQEELEGPNGAVTIRFASPEDTLLHKLVWFRLGNEISDRRYPWGPEDPGRGPRQRIPRTLGSGARCCRPPGTGSKPVVIAIRRRTPRCS